MKKPNKILIISDSASFPWGMAASNRVRNLAKGLVMSNQFVVEYWGLRGAEVEPSGDKIRKGVCEGIKYFYPGGISVRPTSWWVRRLDDLLGQCFAVINILLAKFTGELSAVIIYSREYYMVLFWCHFLHLLHIPVILEVCEWPLARAVTRKQGIKEAEKFCFNVVPKMDAVLPISTYIDYEIKKIAARMKKNVPSFMIPILIDIDPSKFPPKRKTDTTYLMYSGDVDYLHIALFVVDIMCELKSCGINIHLKFTGRGENFAKVKQYADQKGILTQIEITGFLEEYELYKLMREALALLAPLPETLQSEARFSTKLGYYLVSGAPVVTNAVGDVSKYLKDGINAFVAKEFDSRQFASKIEQIINDPVQAEQVGRNGQKLALEKFYYSKACKGLNDFLQEVISCTGY